MEALKTLVLTPTYNERNMCLMLYMASSHLEPVRSSSDLSIEEIEDSRAAVRQWFSLPFIRFIGAHTGCSCGFPSFIANEPLEHFEGMFKDCENREADLRSVDSLLALVRNHVTAGGEVQLYPTWDGQEDSPPKGTINVAIDTLTAEAFFFVEQFFYRVAAGVPRDA